MSWISRQSVGVCVREIAGKVCAFFMFLQGCLTNNHTFLKNLQETNNMTVRHQKTSNNDRLTIKNTYFSQKEIYIKI